MGVGSATTGRASKNRTGDCIRDRAGRAAAPVGKGIFMLI